MSNHIMIMHHQLHLHESRGTITSMMTHQPGAAIKVKIDLHLGQKPKLGGRYTDDSLIYILYFVGPLYIHVLVFISTFPKHKKTKNISVVSLYLVLLSLLPLVCFTCYFQFAI
jgi:hypothetical protein